MGPNPEATYAALCQAYAPRNPFREFGHREIDLNRLRILIEWLPRDSPMHRAEDGSQGWGALEFLVAQLIDATNVNTAVTAATAGAEYQEPKKFPIPSMLASTDEAAQDDAAAQQAAQDWFNEQFS